VVSATCAVEGALVEVAGVSDAVEGSLVAEATGEVGCEARGPAFLLMIETSRTAPNNTQATMTQPRKFNDTGGAPLFFGCGDGVGSDRLQPLSGE